MVADDTYRTAHLHIGWRSKDNKKSVWNFEPMTTMEHLDIVKRVMKTAKFKKTLVSLMFSIVKQYNVHEDAKSSVVFVNNSEEYHVKSDSPLETEYVVMFPDNMDLEQVQEFVK
jgi:hypothetical protein